MSNPRKHHYCPQFYLANFAQPQTDDGKMFVFDCKSLLNRTSKPQNEAHQRDFYRINATDLDPMKIEKFIGDIESEAAIILREIIATRSLPKSGSLEKLLHFVALFSLRTPEQRDKLNHIYTAPYLAAFRELLSTRERWVQFIESSESESDLRNTFAPPDYKYIQFKSFLDFGHFTIQEDQDLLINKMLELVKLQFEELKKRTWFLAESDNHYVTSDNPVGYSWITQPNPFRPPDIRSKNVGVSFPLTPSLCLVGFHRKLAFRIWGYPLIKGPFVNTITALNAKRFIYSSAADFTWHKNDNQNGNLSDFKNFIDPILKQKQKNFEDRMAKWAKANDIE